MPKLGRKLLQPLSSSEGMCCLLTPSSVLELFMVCLQQHCEPEVVLANYLHLIRTLLAEPVTLELAQISGLPGALGPWRRQFRIK